MHLPNSVSKRVNERRIYVLTHLLLSKLPKRIKEKRGEKSVDCACVLAGLYESVDTLPCDEGREKICHSSKK